MLVAIALLVLAYTIVLVLVSLWVGGSLLGSAVQSAIADGVVGIQAEKR